VGQAGHEGRIELGVYFTEHVRIPEQKLRDFGSSSLDAFSKMHFFFAREKRKLP
jgi:hypothetical protein